jgi:hypothetical protein
MGENRQTEQPPTKFGLTTIFHQKANLWEAALFFQIGSLPSVKLLLPTLIGQAFARFGDKLV